jgi:hypothetical protein
MSQVPVPEYPLEMPHRLCVQARERGSDKWGEPRPATIEDFIAIVHELRPDDHERLMRALSAVPSDIAAQLAELDAVTDALRRSLTQSLVRLSNYRDEYPRRNKYGDVIRADVIDAEFPEVDES